MVFNCDCMLFKSKNKANLYQIQNFTLFSQWESHQSLSENRGSQLESNENPIKAHQKTEVLNQNPMRIPSKPIRKQRFSIRIQWESHQSLSENRGSQSESNENPIKAYQKREDFSKPYRSLGEELGFLIYYCGADPPQKNIGGTPFTIVDVTLADWW